MEEFEILKWDSDFFGIKIARILPVRLDSVHLNSVLEALKEKNVVAAYWACDSTDQESQKAAKRLKGILADRKTKYKIDLSEIEIKEVNISGTVEEFSSRKPNRALYDLAVQSGAYSRFRVDSNFSKQQFEDLYKKWIEQSTSRTLACVVFVVKEGKEIVGMICLGDKNGQGRIVLFAVNSQKRGRNYGQALVMAAHAWFFKKGYRTVQVVTQGSNIPACRFYEKCGYRVEKVENVYHFWLHF